MLMYKKTGDRKSESIMRSNETVARERIMRSRVKCRDQRVFALTGILNRSHRQTRDRLKRVTR